MRSYQFENPEFLWALLLLPLLAYWFWRRDSYSRAALRYPEAGYLAGLTANSGARWRHLLSLLRLASIALVIIALARPRNSDEKTRSRSSEGINIVLAVDLSASMLAQDFKPDRLEATKRVAHNFIKDRPGDRIGLVVYAGESYTQTPLTTDHRVLLNSLKELKHGLIEDGTAIGMGLATAVNRLKEASGKGKVVILMTDGENNRGQIDPQTAAQLAQEYQIRVYTIGVGSKGTARTPVAYDGRGGFRYAQVPVSIDEELLREIAQNTGGRYFRATDQDKLQAIYQEIDQLEKTQLQELKFYTYDEKFSLFALWALGLFCLELILRYSWLKSFV